jgi:hypothetical protein
VEFLLYSHQVGTKLIIKQESTAMANALGKRYMCEKCGTEVLCNKAGSGSLECCEGDMKLKEAKPLPSSD